jgi:hypothetical protein
MLTSFKFEPLLQRWTKGATMSDSESSLALANEPMPTFCDDIQPSVLPLLVHTDLAHYSHPTCPLIIHTGLLSSVRPIRMRREKNRRRSPYNAVSTSSSESARGGPLPQQVRETIAEDTAGQQAISKPPGEAGRPGRGGYTLEKAVAPTWDKRVFERIQVCCRV